MDASAHSDLLLLVGRIDGKMDTLLNRADDHGKRLAALENWRWKIVGVIIGIGALAGKDIISPVVSHFFTH